MQRFSVVSVVGALLAIISLVLLAACGGSTTQTPVVANIILNPATLSLNKGGVGAVSASATNAAGSYIAADITFTSSNPAIATVSSGGLVCGGVWDTSFVNCNARQGQAGVGQVTITATSGTATANMTVYVHEQVDRVEVVPPSGCVSMGQLVNATTYAFSTSAPGCSQASPCDITSTVGPIALGSNDLTVVANSAGIEPTYSPTTNSPTYTSGGTITGSTGQTCNLSNFTVPSTAGIDPTYNLVTNSPTYTSGGTVSGSAGQTCSLSNFNGVTGANATVTLTSANTIVSGARLTVTASGFGATTPPTTATLGNGTATCSGTATVITALTSGGSGLGVIDAKATVTLTGTNTVAGGTHLNVTSQGYGATTPPTSATLSSGTATCSGAATVITALSGTGVFTAEGPGSTTIFGSVSGVNSVGVPYLTCPVVQIAVQSSTDSSTSFSLATGGTQPLVAYVTDSKGNSIAPQLTWASSASAAVTVASAGSTTATITAVAPGTASITATCGYPVCNNGVPARYSEGVVTANVTGSNTTTVYAGSTSSLSVFPISTSTNQVGTALTLPFLPNSMISDRAGTNLYLGSSSGLMVLNLASSTVTTYSINGTVIAISPNGNYLLLSDNIGNVVYNFIISTQALPFTNPGITTTSGAYTPDSNFDSWISTSQLLAAYPTAFVSTTTLPYTSDAMDFIAAGGLTYITSSSGHEIDVRSTCDQSEVQTLPANNPTLIKAIPNGLGAVAADSPAVDVILTGLLGAGCPITTPSTLASVDLGVGPFKAQQMFMSSDSSHAWIIPSDQPELLGFTINGSTPFIVPYNGDVMGLSGGITMDSSQIYVGTSEGNVHRIAVANAADVQQISVPLKDANGNFVAPNLVYVLPH